MLLHKQQQAAVAELLRYYKVSPQRDVTRDT